MKNWSVRVRGTIVKDMRVEAETQEEAEELADQLFSSECDGLHERYDQEVLSSCELEDEPCV